VKIRFDRQRLITSGIAALALAFIVFGCRSSVTGAAAVHPPAGVDRFIPAPGELVLRQTQIGADLATGFRGILVIDGQSIPTYDLATNDCSENSQRFSGKDAVFDPGQNTVYYTPGPGSTIERFAPGEHRVSVRFWRLCENPDTAQSANWTFKVA
jgi:hypothetical protein